MESSVFRPSTRRLPIGPPYRTYCTCTVDPSLALKRAIAHKAGLAVGTPNSAH
ncbi:hypothetical protein BD777DRAFT_46247 [Yarrowia lipolytica]|nr:hypothetical protein BD777DRAFT_46247 [Yarrowia lipolytica]